MSTTEPIRMLGRYELLRRIAKGGMGEIYLARTRGMAGFEKNCIIKTILPHLAEEDEFVTKFLDEGRIVVQLVHGNIVPVFDMGDEGGEVYMAMEYIPGRDLREVTKRLKAQGELMPVDLALFVVGEVCKGLDYAHRKKGEDGKSLGIVHRDISPSNVLISREGEIKLIDFGIARAAGRLGKTVSGRIQGKFCYMSPEQASGQPLDGRSDIFSAGLVLYELLTGFRPFEGGTDLESLDLVRKCEFDPPGALNANVPEEIDAIVKKALSKDPAERYQSADKFQIALLQYLYSTGSSPTPSDLAEFLGELFPAGLERDELRSARDASGSPQPPKAMSLDEALDFELGKLKSDSGPSGSGTVDVDPHETTAISSAEMDTEAPNGTQTHARGEPTAPTAPTKPEPRPESAAPATESKRRPLLLGAVIALLILGAGAVYAVTSSQKGKRTISSDPPGAQISVDGLLIPGAVTPHTLKLEEGSHEVTLELEGHETRKIALNVEGGTSEAVPTTVLRARVEQKGPQTFQLHTTPERAELLLDGAVLGQPVITLKPGEIVTIQARADGCTPMSKQIEYGSASGGINFDLNCSSGSADAGQSGDAPSKLTITVDTRPSGAAVTANGKSLGNAPVEWSGMSDEKIRFRAKKGELEGGSPRRLAADFADKITLPLKEKTGAAGCLKFSIDNPFVAEWYIDGKRIGQMRGEKRKVASGTRKVRVKNDVVGLDYSTTVKVKPGSDCAELYLDGAKL